MTFTIEPGAVERNTSEPGRTNWLVYLPEGATPEALRDPNIWSRVQQSNDPVEIHDHLYMVGHDRAWAVTGTVEEATLFMAQLGPLRLYDYSVSILQPAAVL